MNTVFAVMATSFSGGFGSCETETTSVEFVTFDRAEADRFVKEKNSKRTSAWDTEFRVDEVELR